MMEPTEELAMVRNYLLNEYKRLYKLSHKLLNDDGDITWYDYTHVDGEMIAIVRVMGYVGMQLPDMTSFVDGPYHGFEEVDLDC